MHHSMGRSTWLPRPRSSNNALSKATRGTVTDSALRKPERINVAIKQDTSNFDQLTLKADQDTLWTEWWMKLAVIDVEFESIVANIDPQYLKELEVLPLLRKIDRNPISLT